MATKKDKEKFPNQIPPLKNYGGVRLIQKRLERSGTLEANREAVAYALLSMANTKLSDIMEWDSNGNVTVKASREIPEHALHAIKKRVEKWCPSRRKKAKNPTKAAYKSLGFAFNKNQWNFVGLCSITFSLNF